MFPNQLPVPELYDYPRDSTHNQTRHSHRTGRQRQTAMFLAAGRPSLTIKCLSLFSDAALALPRHFRPPLHVGTFNEENQRKHQLYPRCYVFTSPSPWVEGSWSIFAAKHPFAKGKSFRSLATTDLSEPLLLPIPTHVFFDSLSYSFLATLPIH